MVSLKNKPFSDKETEVMPMEEEAYPWGSRITIEKFHLQQLDLSNVEVGDTVQITAVAEVVGHNRHDSMRGPDHESMEFQLTEIEIDATDGDDDQVDDDKLGDRAKLLY